MLKEGGIVGRRPRWIVVGSFKLALMCVVKIPFGRQVYKSNENEEWFILLEEVRTARPLYHLTSGRQLNAHSEARPRLERVVQVLGIKAGFDSGSSGFRAGDLPLSCCSLRTLWVCNWLLIIFAGV